MVDIHCFIFFKSVFKKSCHSSWQLFRNILLNSEKNIFDEDAFPKLHCNVFYENFDKFFRTLFHLRPRGDLAKVQSNQNKILPTSFWYIKVWKGIVLLSNTEENRNNNLPYFLYFSKIIGKTSSSQFWFKRAKQIFWIIVGENFVIGSFLLIYSGHSSLFITPANIRKSEVFCTIRGFKKGNLV